MEDKELKELAKYILSSEPKNYTEIFSKLTKEEESRLIPFLKDEARRIEREELKRIKEIKEEIAIEKVAIQHLKSDIKAEIARTKEEIKKTIAQNKRIEKELERARINAIRKEYLTIGEA